MNRLFSDFRMVSGQGETASSLDALLHLTVTRKVNGCFLDIKGVFDGFPTMACEVCRAPCRESRVVRRSSRNVMPRADDGNEYCGEGDAPKGGSASPLLANVMTPPALFSLPVPGGIALHRGCRDAARGRILWDRMRRLITRWLPLPTVCPSLSSPPHGRPH